MARPKKYDIDTEQLEKLAELGCTNIEIASFFGCSDSLIRKRYSEYVLKGKEKGKIRLRQWQMRAARNGNAALLIWLGKQILGQADRKEIEFSDNQIKEIKMI